MMNTYDNMQAIMLKQDNIEEVSKITGISVKDLTDSFEEAEANNEICFIFEEAP